MKPVQMKAVRIELCSDDGLAMPQEPADYNESGPLGTVPAELWDAWQKAREVEHGLRGLIVDLVLGEEKGNELVP